MASQPKVAIKRRQYNQFVAEESIEDYALRYSPSSFRNWSEFLVANTAIGSISFLALEAIGASIAINYGFLNAFWGIFCASIITFLMGFPICYHAAKHNIDIDLLTRAAGFGYLGSTITSLIYASFCFIFFALEAAIMAQALLLYTGLPLAIGYAICSIIIIPIVFYGMRAINRLQLLTQPIWLILMILPFVMVLSKKPELLTHFFNFSGIETGSAQFSLYHFGLALGIPLALIAQIGEQVDYLRFMPDKNKNNRIKWWLAVVIAGPGWVVLGFLKQIGGILLAALVLLGGASIIEAREPIYMYNAAYTYVFDNPEVALTVSFIFVVISQVKINVTNAYAGSLAWSNFFSRTTHTHPGRVVWLAFNIVIALLLMEIGLFDVLEKILGLYSNIAIAWIAAIVADLVINKPLGLSPPIIEFKRSHLFNINPVGIFSTLIASIFAIIAYSGLLGALPQAFSSIIALVTALILSPLIAYLTKGKYYIARPAADFDDGLHTCGVCNIKYSGKDMASCPMYSTNICSLCCSLEARCHDMCKETSEFSLKDKISRFMGKIAGGQIHPDNLSRLTGVMLVLTSLLFIIGFILWTTYSVRAVGLDLSALSILQQTYLNIFYTFSLLSLIASWLIVLLQESRSFVENELTKKNEALEKEVHERGLVEKKLEFIATYDQLTQLPNRFQLDKELRKKVDEAQRFKERFAVLFFDIDHFKSVNDSLGHELGDELLKQVATRVRSVLREYDILSRFGGDEFVIIMPHVADNRQVSIVANKIVQLFAEPFYLAKNITHITSSIGVSVYPNDANSANALLKSADIAMYRAKDSGRNGYQFFTQQMNDTLQRERWIEAGLRVALDEGQFQLYYQPQLDLNERNIISYEALIRWPVDGTMISPAEFIPVAEKTGLINQITDWVIQKACQQQSNWLKRGLVPIRIDLNLSGKDFLSGKIFTIINQALKQNQLSPKHIGIELTENVLIDSNDSILNSLQQLKASGMHISIDDFGTGYSSLSYLKRFPVSTLKIDQTFVQDAPTDKDDKAIMEAIVAVGHSLGLNVLVEGVETEEQAQLCQEIGCDIGQGYLFARPMPAIELEALLTAKAS
jgi:diguanylate cyclase (GGDEF)-like protein